MYPRESYILLHPTLPKTHALEEILSMVFFQVVRAGLALVLAVPCACSTCNSCNGSPHFYLTLSPHLPFLPVQCFFPSLPIPFCHFFHPPPLSTSSQIAA